MKEKEDLIRTAFDSLKEEGTLTEQQKDKMLSHILMECKAEDTSWIGKLKRMVITYPWRFAFTVATVQSVACTLLFGSNYTSLILGFFGG